jgi:hypothetical protein
MVRERTEMGTLQTRRRLGAFLGFLCITALVLSGCGGRHEPPQPEAAKPSVLPRSMKGYELYSWQEGQEWHFTLITGTNQLKSYQDIVSADDVVETDWVRLSIQGTENLKTVLNRLPEGETVTWNSGRWLEGLGASSVAMQLPNPETIKEVERHCHHLGIRLQTVS